MVAESTRTATSHVTIAGGIEGELRLLVARLRSSQGWTLQRGAEELSFPAQFRMRGVI
jgi:hypothetical protein